MGIFAKLFNKNSEEVSSRNVEDFVSLTRVYFQSVIAANLGITNIRFVPDVANFKRLFKIPTQGGRLGQAEKAASRKMLMQDYGISESFFKEIDASVKKHCRTQNDVQAYLFMYQGFSNDLMMLMGNLMQWKFRMPSIFKGALRSMTEKTVHEVCTKTVWKKDLSFVRGSVLEARLRREQPLGSMSVLDLVRQRQQRMKNQQQQMKNKGKAGAGDISCKERS